VCSNGRRWSNVRRTVRPPTPLSKTPMGASARTLRVYHYGGDSALTLTLVINPIAKYALGG
jgi:hypothetical protein